MQLLKLVPVFIVGWNSGRYLAGTFLPDGMALRSSLQWEGSIGVKLVLAARLCLLSILSEETF